MQVKWLPTTRAKISFFAVPEIMLDIHRNQNYRERERGREGGGDREINGEIEKETETERENQWRERERERTNWEYESKNIFLNEDFDYRSPRPFRAPPIHPPHPPTRPTKDWSLPWPNTFQTLDHWTEKLAQVKK